VKHEQPLEEAKVYMTQQTEYKRKAQMEKLKDDIERDGPFQVSFVGKQ